MSVNPEKKKENILDQLKSIQTQLFETESAMEIIDIACRRSLPDDHTTLCQSIGTTVSILREQINHCYDSLDDILDTLAP